MVAGKGEGIYEPETRSNNLIDCYACKSSFVVPFASSYTQNVVNCFTDHIIRNHGVLYLQKAAKEICYYDDKSDFHDMSLWPIKIVVD